MTGFIHYGLIILASQLTYVSATTEQVYACINEEMTIDCRSQPGKVVFITAADFGQNINRNCSSTSCCPPNSAVDCVVPVKDIQPDDLDRYRQACVNQTDCTVRAMPGHLSNCSSPYFADYVKIHYYCGAADGSDRTTTTEAPSTTTPTPEVTTPPSTSVGGHLTTDKTTTPPGGGGANIGGIIGGVISTIVAVTVVVIAVVYSRKRHCGQTKCRGKSVTGFTNGGLTADNEWEMDQKRQRQLSPVIVEQEVKPRNSSTLARPRKDMPPENMNKPQKRYTFLLQNSSPNGEAGSRNSASPPRDSTTSQNGVSPGSKGNPQETPKRSSAASKDNSYSALGKDKNEHQYTELQKNGSEKTKESKENEYEDVITQ